MPGILREVAEHALDVRAGSRPVKQRLRRFDEEKCRAIGEEVQKLLVAGFIKEVSHPDASTVRGKCTSRPKPSKPSPLHGPSPSGGWTWLGRYRKPPRATPICW